jgi:heat shock protein HtpX
MLGIMGTISTEYLPGSVSDFADSGATMPAMVHAVPAYNRIVGNRVRAVVVALAAIASVLPLVAGIGYATAELVVMCGGRHQHVTKSLEADLRQELAGLEAQPEEITTDSQHLRIKGLRERLEGLIDLRSKEESANRDLWWESMSISALGVCLGLGLLCWMLVSSPTSNLLTLCNARPLGANERNARRTLVNLASRAGLPPPPLYVIDTPAPNALATGMSPKRSIVVVTHGLLALLNERELEAVLAHELSHIGNRDTRLNTLVASITLFLRLPFILRHRALRARKSTGFAKSPNYRLKYKIALMPFYVYAVFVAPFLATVIRASVSRRREFLADADAERLTGFSGGLQTALAKIGGAGSMIEGFNPIMAHLCFADPAPQGTAARLLTGTLLATHPTVEQRIQELARLDPSAVSTDALAEAVHAGEAFHTDHPPLPSTGLTETVTSDELSVLTIGNPGGRVFRTLSPTRLYDQGSTNSIALEVLPAGTLLVVFDDPGKFRQVLTRKQRFGYIPATIKLRRVDMLPGELFDPVALARVDSAFEAIASLGCPAGDSQVSDVIAAGTNSGLSSAQIAFAGGFFVMVFAAILLALMTFGK